LTQRPVESFTKWRALWHVTPSRRRQLPGVLPHHSHPSVIYTHSVFGRRWRRHWKEPPTLWLALVAIVQVEQELGGPPSEECGSHYVREPVRVMPHPSEPVECRERVGGSRHLPFVVKALADDRRERKTGGSVPGDEGLTAAKERRVAVARRVGTQPSKCRLHPERDEARQRSTLATREGGDHHVRGPRKTAEPGRKIGGGLRG